ncbi:gamma-glutamyltransferase family protein [Rhizobium sp. YIM 134829]|uniref:gamma-glutamyltransferase family protein n=1 Tax=Rhizobium sp. YIM 134829 TaxID=3390453 RepID=UPI00397DAE1C
MAGFVRQTTEAAARSLRGVVTTPHWASSEAGARVLAEGGTAIEALVAAGAALAVVYPHFCGLGGDGVWMIADAGGEATALLGIGQAAAGAIADAPIPLRGPEAALTTACLVDSWDTALRLSTDRWGGRLGLHTLLGDAIRLADEGFPVSPSQTFWHDFRTAEQADWPGFSELFLGDGLQRQPALGQTLRRIAADGARSFYDGALAEEIAADLADAGAPLTLSDLAATRTDTVAPLRLAYRDLTLLAPPPPTQGVTTLGIMGVLDGLDMAGKPVGSADFVHALVEAVKQAFLDRPRIADPAFAPDVSTDLLDPQRLAAKTRAIDPSAALPWPYRHQTGDTALLAAVDSEGRTASLLQSLYFDWGSGVVGRRTGILWQNRGAAFSVDPESPNLLVPGKRPFYTLNPGLALKDGRPCLAYGTQGADGQPQTLSLLLSLLIDHGLDPLSALSAPRFLLGRTFSDLADSLKIESSLGEPALSALRDLGHEVAPIPPFSPLGGQAGVIRIHADGLIEAAHDPRSDGGAIGL